MTSSFSDLNNIGSGKSNGIDKNNIAEARRQFQKGDINVSLNKSKELGNELGVIMMQRALEASKGWPPLEAPSHEELHHEAA